MYVPDTISVKIKMDLNGNMYVLDTISVRTKVDLNGNMYVEIGPTFART